MLDYEVTSGASMASDTQQIALGLRQGDVVVSGDPRKGQLQNAIHDKWRRARRFTRTQSRDVDFPADHGAF
jgi:hypothetical protein